MYLYTPLQHLLLGDGAGGEAEAEAEAADDLSVVEAEAADDLSVVEAEAAEDGERAVVAEAEVVEVEAAEAEVVEAEAEAEAVDILIHLIFIMFCKYLSVLCMSLFHLSHVIISSFSILLYYMLYYH